MAPHSSTLAWKIPWTEEPGGLQSVGSRRVRHDWATSLSLFTFMHWRRKWQPTPVFLPGESQGQEPGGLPSMGLHSQTRLNWLSSSSSSHPYKVFCGLAFGSDLVSPGTLKGHSSECLKCLINQLGLATGSFCTSLNRSKKAGLVDVWPLQFHLKLRDKTSMHQLFKFTFWIRQRMPNEVSGFPQLIHCKMLPLY